MHKNIILKAFEKADLLRKKQGDKKPSLINKSEDISEFILKETGFLLGEKSFRIYRQKAVELKNTDNDININQQKVVLGLLKYIGFDNYEDFEKENNALTKQNNNIKLNFFLKYKTPLIIIAVISIGIYFFYKNINSQRWMVWNGNNYVETDFDTKKYNIGQLKIYNEDRILNFGKIIPNCQYKFFEDSGKANLWYGKNKNGSLEYFSSIGKHPQTGKTLKEITNYMIKTHICP